MICSNSIHRMARVVLGLPGLFLLLTLSMAQNASAKVYVEINQPSQEPFPIAIPEFKNLTNTPPPRGLSAQFADLITSDLRLTGLFSLLDRKAFLEDPQKAGLLADQFNFSSWSQIDALGLVKGGYKVRGSNVTIQLRIFDVLASAQIGGKVYAGSLKNIRRLAHQMASDIVFQFTGQPGFFTSKLAAVSDATGHKEIVIMDVDGQSQTQLSNNRSINILPAWSPRGNKLAYTSYRAGNPDLYVANLVRGVTRRIAFFNGINSGASWSPDGKEIALTLSKDGDPDIYLINESGRELKRLTRSYGVDSTPSWSPDGQKLVFVSSRAGGAHIYSMNRDGSNAKRLTFQRGQNVSPVWSPKGDRIAFAGRTQGAFHIFVMNADGTQQAQITSGQVDHEDPTWSPDGNYLAYSATSRGTGKAQIYISSADGRSQVQITDGKSSFTNPKWSPFVDW